MHHRQMESRDCRLPRKSGLPVGLGLYKNTPLAIISSMTKLSEGAVAQVRTLPDDEQDRAAEALLAFAQDRGDYTFDAERIEGIRHAIVQADNGKFASAERLRKIFGRAL